MFSCLEFWSNKDAGQKKIRTVTCLVSNAIEELLSVDKFADFK
jgi:hypothetical protein